LGYIFDEATRTLYKTQLVVYAFGEGLLAKIDMVAKNRSEYIGQAIEHSFD
jgi:hypothetical protein